MKTLLSNTLFGKYLETKELSLSVYKQIRQTYDQFLLQTLELWMFVPCDEDGNVLDQPCEIMNTKGCRDCACREYQQAKERCLFDEFRLDGKYLWHKNNLFMVSNNIQESFSNRNIEFLLSTYKTEEIKLTSTAQKQIGL